MSTIRTLNARDVYNYTVEQIWQLPEEPLRLIFDDGELGTTHEDSDQRIKEFVRMTYFSYYCGVFHRHYPKTPCLMRHHMDGNQFTKKVSLLLLERGFFDAYDAYEGQVDIEAMMMLVNQTNNDIYNDFTERLKEYVTSISVMDFIKLSKHPDIEGAMAKLEPTPKSIQDTYDTIDTTINSPELYYNPVVRVVRSNPKTRGQLHQIIGPRGDLTEMEGTIFPHPILTGYLYGLKTMHDSMIESRSAAKALAYADSIIRDSEYFNRQLQISMAHLQRLHNQFARQKKDIKVQSFDCGTKDTLPFKVTSENLRSIVGKYYESDDGSFVRIKDNDQHLIGALIGLRSVLKCEHPDPQGFCATCFGELALSIPQGTNLGHACATVFCEISSQAILSAKHLDRSASSGSITIDQYGAHYIRPGFGPNEINLTPECKGKSLHMLLDSSEAKGLGQLDQVKDVRDISVRQVTDLAEVAFIENPNTPQERRLVVPVSRGTVHSSLSIQALEYIKIHGLSVKPGSYLIDLSQWDIHEPLFVLPMKEVSMGDHMDMVGAYFKSKTSTRSTKSKKPKEPKCLRDHPTAGSALVALSDMVRARIDINLAHLEVMVASAMVQDEQGGDFKTPHPPAVGDIGAFNNNMKGRSLSAVMAWEGQKEALKNIRSFKGEGRPDHPLDDILVPRPYKGPYTGGTL